MWELRWRSAGTLGDASGAGLVLLHTLGADAVGATVVAKILASCFNACICASLMVANGVARHGLVNAWVRAVAASHVASTEEVLGMWQVAGKNST